MPAKRFSMASVDKEREEGAEGRVNWVLAVSGRRAQRGLFLGTESEGEIVE